MDQLESRINDTDKLNILDTAKDLHQNNNVELGQFIDTIGVSVTSVLNILLSPEPLIYENEEEQLPHYKKKKKRKRRPPGI
ncbi:hypothetical protein MG290_13445 [Flavobacterium sp. CBA20B-1]|uniref:hypothetical protein n=1 Tax=unclassified Flavobacterium TaxID=196869 RepID=UPI002224DF62|nr:MULTISPECIES: hypothetical protein [unclassified Flavobacterium]WCM41929.1 hypothetical protein MG290_13445 [Flavobacterium sp. CBA20B-1]